jgi:hypothetical protein
MRDVKYQMQCKGTAQPVTDENHPHLPSKPIRDAVTKIRATTSGKRTAVKPSEGENVIKILKRGKILKQGLHQRSKISALRHSKPYQCKGPTVALTKLPVCVSNI